MTPQEAKQLLESPIFKAYVEGKTIQYKHELSSMNWRKLPEVLNYSELLSHPERYRIKETRIVYTFDKPISMPPTGILMICFPTREDAQRYIDGCTYIDEFTKEEVKGWEIIKLVEEIL